MQFKLSAFSAILAATSSVIAAPVSGPTPEQVKFAIQSITTGSGNLNTKLQSLQGPISIGQVRMNSKYLCPV